MLQGCNHFQQSQPKGPKLINYVAQHHECASWAFSKSNYYRFSLSLAEFVGKKPCSLPGLVELVEHGSRSIYPLLPRCHNNVNFQFTNEFMVLCVFIFTPLFLFHFMKRFWFEEKQINFSQKRAIEKASYRHHRKNFFFDARVRSNVQNLFKPCIFAFVCFEMKIYLPQSSRKLRQSDGNEE